ncbi:hypothetical protein, partial [Salmonella sp. s51228]|uniref:hypothetical protein n=1 Tax=Salmonella sp. s51228 TaxID=3159652 RepID=UPI0039805E74
LIDQYQRLVAQHQDIINCLAGKNNDNNKTHRLLHSLIKTQSDIKKQLASIRTKITNIETKKDWDDVIIIIQAYDNINDSVTNDSSNVNTQET